MNIPLQEWIDSNAPKDEMHYKQSWIAQVCFIRDEIPGLLAERKGPYELFKTIQDNITVISEHTSKSIHLPVYRIKANGDTFILRNNFYDWKVSVETSNVHNIDFQKLGVINHTDTKVDSIYCEGFSSDWVYDSYDKNKRKYTVEIYNNFQLKLFFWLINKSDLMIWRK